MASFPTSKLVNPDINDFKQFEKEVKDKYDIDKFNATEPYEIHIVGSSRLLEDLDSVQELRRYSQDLDAIMALYHLDSEMTEEEAIDDMGTEEWLIRADEMQPGFLQNRASFMIDDMDDVEEEPQINRRFGSF